MKELIEYAKQWYQPYRDVTDINMISEDKLMQYMINCIAFWDIETIYKGIKIQVLDVIYPQVYRFFDRYNVNMPMWTLKREGWQIFLGDNNPPLYVVLGVMDGMFLKVIDEMKYGHRVKSNGVRDIEINSYQPHIEQYVQPLATIYLQLLHQKPCEGYYNFVYLYDSYRLQPSPHVDTPEDYMQYLEYGLLGDLTLLPEEAETIELYKEKINCDPRPGWVENVEENYFREMFILFAKRFPPEEEQQEEQPEEENTNEVPSKEEMLAYVSINGHEENKFNMALDSNKYISGDMIVPKPMIFECEKSAISSISSPSDNFNILNHIIDDDFSFLHRILRMRTKNHTYGEPTDKGRKIVKTRLTRILTDQKIFSYDSEIDLWKPPHIIFLMDFSNSMSMRLGYKDDVITYYQYVSMVCYKMATITKNFTKTDIYAHTTAGSGENSYPIVLHITENMSDSINLACNRIKKIYNMDGVVLEKLSELYENKTPHLKKLFIVLSDGDPTHFTELRYDSIKHTKRVIENIREKGQSIVGISLIRDSDRGVKHLYGDGAVMSGNLIKNIEDVITKQIF